jgi:hypothetical protein
MFWECVLHHTTLQAVTCCERHDISPAPAHVAHLLLVSPRRSSCSSIGNILYRIYASQGPDLPLFCAGSTRWTGRGALQPLVSAYSVEAVPTIQRTKAGVLEGTLADAALKSGYKRCHSAVLREQHTTAC